MGKKKEDVSKHAASRGHRSSTHDRHNRTSASSSSSSRSHAHGHTAVRKHDSFVSWLFSAKVTLLLIVLNVAAYIASQRLLSAEELQALYFTPASLFAGDLVPLVASWFLHANIFHLVGNMLFLFIFGRVVERELGSLKTLLLYFVAALLTDVIGAFVFGIGGIGASHAIYGLMAAAILRHPYYRMSFLRLPIPILFLGWLQIYLDIQGIISPIEGNTVSHLAHLLGFMIVTLIMFALHMKEKEFQRGLLLNVATFVAAYFLYKYQDYLFSALFSLLL